jgi:hypothetical protein
MSPKKSGCHTKIGRRREASDANTSYMRAGKILSRLRFAILMFYFLLHGATAIQHKNSTKASTQSAYATSAVTLTVTVAGNLTYEVSEEWIAPKKYELPSSTTKKVGRGVGPVSSTSHIEYANATTMTVTIESECIQSTEIGSEVTIAGCGRGAPSNSTRRDLQAACNFIVSCRCPFAVSGLNTESRSCYLVGSSQFCTTWAINPKSSYALNPGGQRTSRCWCRGSVQISQLRHRIQAADGLNDLYTWALSSIYDEYRDVYTRCN